MFTRLTAYSIVLFVINSSSQAETIVKSTSNCVQLVNNKLDELQKCSIERWNGLGRDFIQYKLDDKTYLIRQENGGNRVAYLIDNKTKKETKVEVVN